MRSLDLSDDCMPGSGNGDATWGRGGVGIPAARLFTKDENPDVNALIAWLAGCKMFPPCRLPPIMSGLGRTELMSGKVICGIFLPPRASAVCRRPPVRVWAESLQE